MSERIEFLSNGQSTHAPTSRRKGRPAERPPSKPSKPGCKRLGACRAAALFVGAVGVGVLLLSVSHCCTSISLLTGSHALLAGLLAVGIDAGMVACELAILTSHGTQAGANVKPWATGYVVVAVALSMLLNAYAFGLHAADGMRWAAYLLGVVLPCLVFILGKVSGELWLARK